MTARKYLQQLHSITRNLWILHEEIERRRAKLESTTIPIKQDSVQSSGKGDALADGIAALADKEVSYEMLAGIYEDLRDRIVRQIMSLDNPVHSELLYRYYVKGEAMTVVAKATHYSYQYACKLHRDALRAFEKKYAEFLTA